MRLCTLPLLHSFAAGCTFSHRIRATEGFAAGLAAMEARVLCRLGIETPGLLDRYRERLASADQRVVRHAEYELGRMGTPGAVKLLVEPCLDPLVAALGDRNAMAQRQAAEALGDPGREGAARAARVGAHHLIRAEARKAIQQVEKR